MTPELVRRVHTLIETPTWAPWLRFDLRAMQDYDAVFPEGQIVHLDDGGPIGALTSLRISWSGHPDELGTWDAVSGHDTSVREAHDPEGNTLVMLSVSIRSDRRGRGVPAVLVDHARRVARDLGLEHLISPFRPSGFGAHKAEGGDVDFDAYCASRRGDGLPIDPWLRALTRLGMQPIRPVDGAMVVPVPLAELEELRRTYRPEAWYRLDDVRAGALASHLRAGVGHPVDEVWECGETGAWFVDLGGRRATYSEANLWGEVPLAPVGEEPEAPATDTDDEVVIDLRDDGPRLRGSASLAPLRADLVRSVGAGAPGEEVAVGWVESTDPRAEVVRDLEACALPDIGAFLTPEVERQCRFLVVVDLRAGRTDIAHAYRVSSPRYHEPDASSAGMPTIDEIVATNPEVSLDEVRAHYDRTGFELSGCIAVESSFRVAARSEGVNGMRWSDYGYVALFLELVRDADDDGRRGVFAHANEATVRSLKTIDISVEPFLGRPELRSPSSQPGTHDDAYSPVFIPARGRNDEVFRSLEAVAAAEVEVEVVIDLRDAAPAAGGSEGSRQEPVHK